MTTPKRYILEGTWSGYHSAQRRIVHRQLFRKPVNLSCIRYTDGTTLDISVRPAKPRERVKEIHGYTSLVRDALAIGKDYVSVDEIAARKRHV
ncbi:MAG TPA: hypothetical protein VFE62_26245 [Gemmataceae bacterium]|nr:hypothetical protein [Gemmataceae bacterium]